MNAGNVDESDLNERLRLLLQLNQVDTDRVRPTTYEAVTRQMVESLTDDVKEIRNRINGLFWLIAGTVVVEVMTRLAGLGT